MAKFLDQSQGAAAQTFSDLWFRLADTRPRLSPHARFVRQRQGPAVCYIVEDPAGGGYYRLTESARFFLGMLDGNRTADDAWRACLEQLGDQAPTQRECIDLLANLQLYGLLAGDQPLAPDMIAERQARFRKNRRKQRTGNWLFFHIPLLNPEPILYPLRGPLRVMWGWPGAVAFAILAIVALFEIVTNLDRLGSSLNTVLDPTNLIWLSAAFLAIRLIHELGHATACKAMGGRCTEIGIMLIAMILPLPYCDASSSWRFPETWKRVLVALGGILIELAVAAIATIVWAHAEPGALRTTAFNVMVLSGITTFLFNLNPLLRYDGYYILSDLTGSPNLASRSKELWKHLILTKLFGVVGSKPPPVRDRAEANFLLTFHALALPYRITVVTAILLIIVGQYLSLGIVLAAVFACIWLILPIVSGIWYLATNPQLVGRRARAIGATLAVIGPILAAVLWLPLPASARVPAVVDWAGLRSLRAEAPGYLVRTAIAPGSRAEAGDVVFVFDNPSLKSDHAAARARLERARILADAAAADAPAKRRVAQTNLQLAERTYQELTRQVESLQIRSPIAGRIAAPRSAGLDLEQGAGRFVRKGEILAFILPDEDPTAGPTLLAAVTDDVSPRLVPTLTTGDTPATARLRGAAGTQINATVTRVWPAGTRELPTTALASSTGGAILQDPENPNRALSPITQIELRPETDPALLYGRRGRVRFSLPPEPIATRLARHVRTLIDARLGR